MAQERDVGVELGLDIVNPKVFGLVQFELLEKFEREDERRWCLSNWVSGCDVGGDIAVPVRGLTGPYRIFPAMVSFLCACSEVGVGGCDELQVASSMNAVQKARWP